MHFHTFHLCCDLSFSSSISLSAYRSCSNLIVTYQYLSLQKACHRDRQIVNNDTDDDIAFIFSMVAIMIMTQVMKFDEEIE